MSKTVRAAFIAPGCEPLALDFIDTHENLQALTGGDPSGSRLGGGLRAWYSDAGLLRGLPANVFDHAATFFVVGNLLVTRDGEDGQDFADITPRDLAALTVWTRSVERIRFTYDFEGVRVYASLAEAAAAPPGRPPTVLTIETRAGSHPVGAPQ